jgi:hypothetical protein
MRFLIVSRSGAPGYAGMDRPTLGTLDDVPEPVVLRGMALEDLRPDQAEAGYRAFAAELAGRYDLLALGEPSGADWELLGYDVGETTRRAWSALAHRQELALPEPRLNRHGLFDDAAEAEQFLRAYLDSDDPDRGWGPEGWEERPSLYAVIPVHRLRASQ